MTDLQLKFRLIFVRFLVIAAVFIPTYTFLNWYVVLYKQWWVIDEGLTNIILPGILSCIIFSVGMWRRLGILNFKHKQPGKDTRVAYIIIATFTLGGSTGFMQHFITTATGKLTRLDNINDIDKVPATKYYTLNQHLADKKRSLWYCITQVTGKGNTSLTWTLYSATPIFKDSINSTNDTPKAWLCVKYGISTDNKVTDGIKDSIYKEFVKRTEVDYNSRDLSGFYYLDRIGNNYNRDNYIETINKDKYYGSDLIVFEPSYDRFEYHNGLNFFWAMLVLGIGSALLCLMMLHPQLDRQKANKYLWSR